MKRELVFDSSARSERYFTSLILPHILMCNDFYFLKVLFCKILNKTDFVKMTDPDIEIVSELDPVRDCSFHNIDIRNIFIEEKRIAVPDLFLRINNQIIIIEAKFFTHPSNKDLKKQIGMQQIAINKVLKYTKYKKANIQYCLLTTLKTNKFNNNVYMFTWDDMIKLIKDNLVKPISKDFYYSLDVLCNSVERAKKSLKPVGKITFKKFKFNELMQNLSNLINNNQIYVGIDGGLNKIEKLSLIDIQNRSHYKVSDSKWSDNWITIDNLIKRYIELNNTFEN
ncbi:MAG: hypothetical protein IT280_02255 [Ignavibacteria bacterium]|nr:hypothetical protein [Ignavibacteria bacterium]